MIRLVLRLALWIAAVVILCFGALGAVLSPARDGDRWLIQLLLHAGLSDMITEIEHTPPADRPAWIAGNPDATALGLEVREGPPQARWLEPAVRLAVPIDDGARYVTVAPFHPPVPDRTTLVTGLALVVIVVFAASVAVALPLARRLAAIEAAMAALEQGDLRARVQGSRDDLVGRLGAGFNGMAEVIARRVQDREELLQAVAHEYGTPLARLSLEIELLAGRLDGQHATRVDRLRGEVRELGELTSELTDWIALEANALARGSFDLADAVTGEVERADDGRVSWVPGARAQLVGDERLFRRAVGNLLRNARRYAASQVQITAEVHADHVVVRVDDDGPGIPDDARDRVFTPFTRLESSRDRDRGGTGLGLAIVRRIAQQHGGAAWAEAAELGGAGMRIRWPRAPG